MGGEVQREMGKEYWVLPTGLPFWLWLFTVGSSGVTIPAAHTMWPLPAAEASLASFNSKSYSNSTNALH